MADNQSIKFRLIELIKALGMSQRRFEQACGFSNGYINNIKKSIQPDKLQSIVLNFPNVNPGWIMTGDGSMMRQRTYETEEEGRSTADRQGEYEQLRREIDELKETIERQNRVIDALTGASAKDKSHMAG